MLTIDRAGPLGNTKMYGSLVFCLSIGSPHNSPLIIIVEWVVIWDTVQVDYSHNQLLPQKLDLYYSYCQIKRTTCLEKNIVL